MSTKMPKLDCSNRDTDQCSAIKKATKRVWQIPIVEGPGDFNIMPIDYFRPSRESSEVIEEDYSQMFSLKEEYISDFLYYFLNKYFDPEYLYDESRSISGSCQFEWYMDNIYTYPTMLLMLDEIEQCAHLLATNYDDPSLAELKKRFSLYSFVPDHPNPWSLSDAEKADIIKANIHIALDFYERFVTRMRKMIAASGEYTAINFEGP